MANFLIGVTGRQNEPLQEADLEILRLARIQAIRTTSIEAPPGVVTFLQYQSGDSWAEAVGKAYKLGVRRFVIHDTPNASAGGWLEYWANGKEFARWWIEIWAEAQSKWPDAEWGFPAMQPGTDCGTCFCDSEVFFEECREALNCADFYEIRTWWKNPEEMKACLWRVDWHQRLYPELPLVVMFANMNSTISKREKARQYLDFYSELARRDNVMAGFAYCLSSADPLDKFASWRSELRQRTPSVIPATIGARDF